MISISSSIGSRGRHKRNTHPDQDKNCLKCQPGTYAMEPCFHKSATVCHPCPDHTFAPLLNLDPHCHPCSSCVDGFFQIQACTSISDTVCQACTPSLCPGLDSDVADMMFGDDHTTYNGDEVEPTAKSKGEDLTKKLTPESKPDGKEKAQIPQDDADSKKEQGDQKVAASTDDVDIPHGSLTEDEGEGSGDGENLVSDDTEEATAKASPPPPTTQPTPVPEPDLAGDGTPPSNEGGWDPNDKAGESKEKEEGAAHVDEIVEKEPTTSSPEEEQPAEQDSENVVSSPDDAKQDPKSDFTATPEITVTPSQEAESQDGKDGDDMTLPLAVDDDVVEDDHKDDTESEQPAQPEQPTTASTHPEEHGDDSDDNTPPLVSEPVRDQDNNELEATIPEPEVNESVNDNGDEITEAPIAEPIIPVVLSEGGEHEEEEENNNEMPSTTTPTEISKVDDTGKENEAVDDNTKPEEGKSETSVDDHIDDSLPPEKDETDKADGDDMVMNDESSPVMAIPVTTPPPEAQVDDDALMVDETSHEDQDHDNEQSKDSVTPVPSEPPHHEHETTLSPPTTEDSAHVPIVLLPSVEENKEDNKDSTLGENKETGEETQNKAATTIEPEEVVDPTESVEEIDVVLKLDAVDGKKESVDDNTETPTSEEEEEKQQEEEEEGEKTTTTTTTTTLPEEVHKVDEDEDQSAPRHIEPQPVIPETTPAKETEHEVDVVLVEEHSSPSPSSSTTRIPTLEEVEGEEDLGSGDVPGIVLGGGEREDEEMGLVVDHKNVTEEAEPEGGGVNVVIDVGQEATTVQPLEQPEDGAQGGEGGSVVVIEESEEQPDEKVEEKPDEKVEEKPEEETEEKPDEKVEEKPDEKVEEKPEEETEEKPDEKVEEKPDEKVEEKPEEETEEKPDEKVEEKPEEETEEKPDEKVEEQPDEKVEEKPEEETEEKPDEKVEEQPDEKVEEKPEEETEEKSDEKMEEKPEEETEAKPDEKMEEKPDGEVEGKPEVEEKLEDETDEKSGEETGEKTEAVGVDKPEEGSEGKPEEESEQATEKEEHSQEHLEEEIVDVSIQELEIEPAKQGGDTEEDEEGKRRTAIIVGVAVGGVALFALGFVLSRHCRKRGGFKVMKKVPIDGAATNGNTESIEFRPVRSGSGIYDEVDECPQPPIQGSYRRVPEGVYTPLATNATHTTHTPIITPSTHQPTFTTAPNGDTYAVVNKQRPPLSPFREHEPLLNIIDHIKFIDETTTEDEGSEPIPRERLLTPRLYHAALPEVEEEENRFKPPEPETLPPVSSFSGESYGSLSEDVLQNVESQLLNGGGPHGLELEEEEEEEEGEVRKGYGGKELRTKGMSNGNVETAPVTMENGHA
ncbi:hypothetical protein ACOMHN_055327 [Nucella lapillus]